MLKHQKKSNNDSIIDSNAVLINEGDERFYEYLGAFGEGYLMASTYGVDLTRRHSDLTGLLLEGDDAVWWPELGVRMNKSALSGVYAFTNSPLGAPAIECDFETVPAGLSFYFLEAYCNNELFTDVVENLELEQVPLNQLMSQRIACMPVFNTCPCCVARAERIVAAVEKHPVSQILESLLLNKQEAEFQIKTNHVSMTAKWCPQEISYSNGQLSVIGGNYTLRVNATIVHAIRVFKRTKAKQEYTVLRCYNTFGEMMMELSLAGSEHEAVWNKMCMSEGSNYESISDGTFQGD